MTNTTQINSKNTGRTAQEVVAEMNASGRTRHHLRYVKPHGTCSIPTGNDLVKQFEKLPALHSGEQINMQDGQIYALILENLSDFDWHFSEDDCKVIISAAPNLVHCRKIDDKSDFLGRVFDTRYVMTPNSRERTLQMLVSMFGEPAWVNVPRYSIFMSESDYQQDKHLFH